MTRLGGAIVLVTVGVGGPVVTRVAEPDAAMGLATAHGRVYAITRRGVGMIYPDARPVPLDHATSTTIQLGPTGVYIVGGPAGVISVMLDSTVLALRLPTDRLSRLAARPSNRFIVASAPGRVFAWDLEPLVPRERARLPMQAIIQAGPTGVVVGAVTGDWRWIDVAGPGESRHHVPPGLYTPSTNQTGNLIVFRPGAGALADRLVVVDRRQLQTIALDSEADAIGIDLDHVLIGRQDGAVIAFDVAARSHDVVASHPAHVAALGIDRGWWSARWVDGTLWRRDRATRREHQVKGDPATAVAIPGLHQRSDGRVYIVQGRMVSCWNLDDSVSRVTTLPHDIVVFARIDDDRLVVGLDDGSLYRVDLDVGQTTTLVTAGGPRATVAPETQLAVISGDDHRVHVVDVAVNASWEIRGATGSGPVITRDGAAVVGVWDGRLLVWRLDLPSDAPTTATWLDKITNATLGPDGRTVRW